MMPGHRERRREFRWARPSRLSAACLSCVQVFLGDSGRVAVEVRVGEHAGGGAGVVEDVEPELAVVVAHAGAAADDLLELAHRADDPGEHDVLAGRRVHAGGEELGGGEDRRRAGLDVLEPAQVAAADVALVGGDAADIVAGLRTRSALRLLRARRISSACSWSTQKTMVLAKRSVFFRNR